MPPSPPIKFVLLLPNGGYIRNIGWPQAELLIAAHPIATLVVQDVYDKLVGEVLADADEVLA